MKRAILALLAPLWLGAQPTFNKDVVPIFQARCQNCHHPGAIGSFSLMDYASTRPYVRSIRQRVADRQPAILAPFGGEVRAGAVDVGRQDANA